MVLHENLRDLQSHYKSLSECHEGLHKISWLSIQDTSVWTKVLDQPTNFNFQVRSHAASVAENQLAWFSLAAPPDLKERSCEAAALIWIEWI